MSKRTTVAQQVSVTVYKEEVEVSMLNHDGTAWITPGEAVQLSRALVAAAAEALGVRV